MRGAASGLLKAWVLVLCKAIKSSTLPGNQEVQFSCANGTYIGKGRMNYGSFLGYEFVRGVGVWWVAGKHQR